MTFDHVRQNIELDRFHDGDESYICDLIRQCTPALRGQIVRLGVDADDGDDLAQETWLRAIERRLQYVGRGSFEAWLSRICYGIYLDQMRSQRRHLSRMSRFSYAEYVSELQEVGYDDESRSVDTVELAVRLRAEIAARGAAPQCCHTTLQPLFLINRGGDCASN